MCGIAGILSFHSDTDLVSEVKQITDLQSHRGPDGEGFIHQSPIALGHRRLSIIDLEAGKQPMSNETGSIWITFNGEIYNFPELRADLQSRGHIFKTHSDTEVIIHGYEEWGIGVLNKLRGMFAFGIADFDNQKLLLARDMIGIKPLVYRHDGSYLAFASEINAIKTVFGKTASGNPEAVDIFLRYGYIPFPMSIYKDIHKLPPGCYLECSFAGQYHIERYWDFSFEPDPAKLPQVWKASLESVIDESVKAHTIADVPYGVLLSGGIDSTLIASSLKRYLGHPSTAFCMDFAEKAYSELSYAQEAAKRIGHNLVSGRMEDVDLELLQKIVHQYGEPFGDSSCIPTWGIARLVRQHVPLVLTGDGGDELFAGYVSGYLGILSNEPWFRIKRGIKEQRPRRIASGLKELLLGTEKTPFRRYVESLSNPGNRELRRQLLQPAFRSYVDHPCLSVLEQAARCEHEPDFLSQIRKLDVLYYLPNDILVKVDIATMAHGLEARPPLIDKEVFSIGARMPSSMNFEYKKRTPNGKILFKSILRSRGFDEAFLMRTKKGFTVPKKNWLQQNGSANRYLREEFLSSEGNPLHRIIRAETLETLIREHENGKDHSKILWYILVLELWIKLNPDVQFN